MSATTAYRRPAPAMQTSYNNSTQQMKGITSVAPQPSSSLSRQQPVAMGHPSQRYKRSSANTYRVEHNGLKPDGAPREVIVIDSDDSPEPSVGSRGSTARVSTSNYAPPANASKRRRPNGLPSHVPTNSSTYYNQYPYQPLSYTESRQYAPTESSSRRVAPSGVGGKRKAADTAVSSKVGLLIWFCSEIGLSHHFR